MNCNTADSEMIVSSIDALQKSRNAELKSFCNDEKHIVNIIDTLIQISMLKREKKKNKEHSWKKMTLKLIQRLQNNVTRKQNMFIAKNVQELKTSIQLLNKQLRSFENMNHMFEIAFWAKMTEEREISETQQQRDDVSSL